MYISVCLEAIGRVKCMSANTDGRSSIKDTKLLGDSSSDK